MSPDPFAEYDFRFPPELVAQKPASPRDSAKLLAYDRKTGETSWDIFRNLDKYLPPRSVLVLNETKVIPARLTLRKETGGRVKILFLERKAKSFLALADRSRAPGERVRDPSGIPHGPPRRRAREAR
jgi:S-adenosylmethionine:tRNA ribosyltransferase-isomerase